MEQKTDNDHLSKKLALRMLAVDAILNRGENTVRVLDCFAGAGVLWRLMKRQYGQRISHVGIDKAWQSNARYLGDNRRYLRLLPLDEYNLIDLDAYGVPYEQMAIISRRHFNGTIVGTFIQCAYGGLPFAMLNELGYPRRMVERVTKLFYRSGWRKWSAYLRLLGYDEVHVYHCANKHYFLCLGKRDVDARPGWMVVCKEGGGITHADHL
jgi:hypothetical protein